MAGRGAGHELEDQGAGDRCVNWSCDEHFFKTGLYYDEFIRQFCMLHGQKTIVIFGLPKDIIASV